MYSWGDDTSTWKGKGGFKYDDAKAPYLDDFKKEAEKKGPKTYLGKSGPNLQLVDPMGKDIFSDSPNPVFAFIDGTGSMAKRPEYIFDRAALFYQTLAQYRPDLEVCLGVVQDARYDKWPFQIGNIGKGPGLDDTLKALHAEGKGGPGIRESYELIAHFLNEHVHTPNALRPLVFIMGDEKFYEQINPAEVKKIFGDDLQGPVDSIQAWKAVSEKYDLYFLRKSYPRKDKEILDQWGEAIGADKIRDVPYGDSIEKDRVIDVAMGIVAQTWGNYSNFKLNLSARQDSTTVEKVEESIRAAPIINAVGEVSLESKVGGKKSKKLMEG
ncbi:MAG: hypothetical protein V2A62_03830 [Candidatus Woesearchaeota archaeon]